MTHEAAAGQFARSECRSTGAESGGYRERFTSAMRTSGPTTRSAHAFSHFIKTGFYTAVPGVVFLSGCHPANPLIACQWRNAPPYTRDNCVRLNRFAKVCRHPVHCTGSDRLSGHGFRSLQVTNGSANPDRICCQRGYPRFALSGSGRLNVRFSLCRPRLV
jgi:hypothetical protein